MRPAARPAQPRNNALAQIHIAKAQLGLDDETYRAMLWGVARVTTAADLDHAGRAKVLAHLKASGFKDRRAGKPRPAPDRAAQMSKIEALLADAGREWAYAHGMAKRMFAIERLEFCTPDHLQRLIAALVYDQKRRAERAAAKERAANAAKEGAV